MSTYFSGCANLDEARTRYRELMKRSHPDVLKVITQEINAEYACVKSAARADGTLPKEYAQAEQSGIKIVYRDRIVKVEIPVEVDRIVYRDRAAPARSAASNRSQASCDDERSFIQLFTDSIAHNIIP